MTGSTEDLRRHPRVSVDVQANIRTSDGRKLIARTRDLSRAGICIITTANLPPGEELHIELVLLLGAHSTSEPLALRARIVWSTAIAGAFQVGAKFEHTSTKEVAFLDMFMRYLDGSILPAGAEMEVLSEDTPEVVRRETTPATKPDDEDDPFKP